MTSPTSKLMLAMCAVMDTVLSEGADALPVFSGSTRQMLLEAKADLDKAVADFRATGGAE